MLKQKRKGGNPKPRGKKGGQFERAICKELSLWWTDNKRDDIFWRTAGSGARATVRSKTGRRTRNQYGDVQATDRCGQPLIDLCTIEIKKGYGNKSYFDLIDKLPNETKQPYRKFIIQAIDQHLEAETEWWLLITKRNRKETLITMPWGLKKEIVKETNSRINKCIPSISIIFNLKESKQKYPIREKIFITTLKEFFFRVSSNSMKDLI